MRAFLVLLFTGLVAVAAGAAGYQAGVLSSIGSGGAGVVYVAGFPHIGGLLFFFLFAALVLFAATGRRRHGAGRGPWMAGHGPWSGGHGPWTGGHGPTGDGDPRRAWIAEAHRRLHEDEAARAAGAPSPTGAVDGTPPVA